MDKNAIKKFAVWARRELISRVSQKALQYGITDTEIVPADAVSVNGVVLSADEIRQRRALIDQIKAKGYEQVMEEVAYTWFNRFIALRFMEVNSYLPSRVRVFTDADNRFKPQILTEAIDLELDGLDIDRVFALKDANDDEALFKYLLITQCNALSAVLPGMFQRISDYTELLFPDNLLRDGSVVEQMIAMIPQEDWTDQVQIIGWLYQYYNSEKKDAVFAALKKNIKITKENIPAATQLFTPDWIVRYMVENSLGRLWVEGHPDEELKSGWKYYLEEAEQEPAVQAQLDEIRREYASMTPEDIKCIDPCMGSGHILAYLFDVLMQIYQTSGYGKQEAVRLIIERNLYGLDIDDRAAQLAYFTVMMKARQYDRRFLARKNADGEPDVPQPHVLPICESNGIDRSALADFINGDAKLKKAMDSILKEMTDAKEYGSILNITPVDFDALYARFDEIHDEFSLSRDAILHTLLPLVRVAQMLSQKYDVVVTNPPYMGASGMGAKLSDFVKKYYPDTKSDMSTVCMEKTLNMCKPNGYMTMINIPVWMFLSTYEKLRIHLLRGNTFINMVHPGRGIFGSDFGTTTFVIRKCSTKGYKGTYRRLFDRQGEVEGIEAREEAFLSGKGLFIADQQNFIKIPSSPVAYWVSDTFIGTFAHQRLKKIARARSGAKTGKNDLFIKHWWEPDIYRINFNCNSYEECLNSDAKWFPYNKGGEARNWYGNRELVIDFERGGANIRKYSEQYSTSIDLNATDVYFKKGITWTALTISRNTFRYSPQGAAFDSNKGPMVFSEDDKLLQYLLGFFVSSVAQYYLKVFNPSLSLQNGDMDNLPIIIDKLQKDYVCSMVEQTIRESKSEWDSFETSWDFNIHPLVSLRYAGAFAWEGYLPEMRVSCAFDAWERLCERRFEKLKANEEELNRIFIDIYGLGDELTPEVEDKDVTVRKADLGRDIRSLISYAVGCMFGRYSLDCEGLAYAGGEWDDSKYPTFPAAADNIIPICDDDYFPDDLLGRFVRFIETVYGSATLEENLRFIADALGGKGQPKEVIRNYFLNDFYADHLKIYQKRPIYWLFDSGKKGGFKALIYMHRYAPDTIARLRTDYVHEQQSRYRTAIADLEQRIPTVSTSERVKLSKKLKKLQEQSTELQTYEEKIHHLADQFISIDLDDGVKKNYEIFKDVLAKIK